MSKYHTSRLTSAAFLAFSLTFGVANAETLRWTRASDALTLDPQAQNDGVTGTLLSQIYETLVWRDAKGKLIPRLATDWKLKDGDPTTWVFTLHKGVKFHDGADLTAEDVVFSLNRARSEKSKLRQLHADVVDVKAADDYTVEIKLRASNLIYPNNLTGAYILDKGWAEKNNVVDVQDIGAGKDNFAVRNANGSGPFVLKSREVDVKTVLDANPNYWGDKPNVTQIVYTPISDAATRVAALLSGEVDFVQDVPVQDIEKLKKTSGVKLQTGAENRSIFLGYRLDAAPLASSDAKDKNPLSDLRVRQAFDLAIDRDALKAVVLRGNSLPAGVIVPPFVRGWTSELDSYSKPDLAKAKALLTEAGYPNGFTITLDAPNNRYVNDEAIAQAVVGFLGRVGVKVTLATRPFAQHSPLLADRKSDFFLYGWGVPTFDSAYNFNDLLHTRGEKYGIWNATYFSDPAIDKKIESLGAELDVDKRDATVAELWKYVKDQHLYLPLHNQVVAWAARDNVNFEIQPDNSPKFVRFNFTK
ncbi:ABC transporter substrate-binding protein [Agrobacterium sp. rho-13.3]|uniref:ABC transporter substrate-binding protein n=1 Tax=Agrobacterium sp. rho-13.3 TaxID=3072980 RepID=UPI002A0FD534|nr:ABC transporter substrate-binding protein [Agrobacterium sp. rho-13.3]MDX8309075.1 ABC transporter substrate-binding protein [Agrobacterium sp. rho-13.3]